MVLLIIFIIRLMRNSLCLLGCQVLSDIVIAIVIVVASVRCGFWGSCGSEVWWRWCSCYEWGEEGEGGCPSAGWAFFV